MFSSPQFFKDLLKNKNIGLWFWIGVATLFLGTFFILTSEVREAAEGNPELIGVIDRLPSQMLTTIRSPKLNGLAVDLTALGSTLVVTIFVIFCSVILVFKRKFVDTIHLIFASLGAGFWTWTLKSFFERPRPEILNHLIEVRGFSYPSGHSLASATVYFTFAVLLCNSFLKWSERLTVIGLALIFIFFVGLSRVYLGVHYISDVMAGLLVGVGWAALVGAARAYLELRRKKYAL